MAISKIRVLDDQTINKIAAGEVVENPASVVKELVENALDASATRICIEIEGGGRQLIRISDNGCGMSQDDALLCLERHATSKIRLVEDVQEIRTMGFRGEAIPSIAAISKFTVLTSPIGEKEGSLLVVDGGRLISCSAAPRSSGTTVEVRSLFFNVPVRRQFQKSPAYDSHAIFTLVGLLALAHPSVEFELIADRKTLLKAIPSSEKISFQDALKKRVASVFGKSHADSLVPLDFQLDSYSVEGLISAVGMHKPNRTGQHLFINQRLVVSPLIAAAVREGYSTMLPERRYPLFILHLRLPGALVDVNVHPQKREVRLRQEKALREAIIRAVHTTLQQERACEVIDSKRVEPPSCWGLDRLPMTSTSPRVGEEPWEFKVSPANLPQVRCGSPSMDDTSSSPMTFFPADLAPASPSLPLPGSSEIHLTQPTILATLMGYCLLDPFNLSPRLFGKAASKKEGGLALLDQRAAYSRIYYERLLNRSSDPETQLLLIPLTLSLTPSEVCVLQEHLALLHKMGFELRELGAGEFVIDAFPAFISQEELPSCFTLLIQDLSEMSSSRRIEMKREERLAWTACRASLPPAKRLLIEEAQGLVQQLLACDVPSCCPQGKPTCVYLSPEEVARFFE